MICLTLNQRGCSANIADVITRHSRISLTKIRSRSSTEAPLEKIKMGYLRLINAAFVQAEFVIHYQFDHYKLYKTQYGYSFSLLQYHQTFA